MQLYHSDNTQGVTSTSRDGFVLLWSNVVVCNQLHQPSPSPWGGRVCCSLTTATQGSSLSVATHYTSCHNSLKRKNINNVVKRHGTTHSRTHTHTHVVSLTLVKIIYLSCTRSIPLPRHINHAPRPGLRRAAHTTPPTHTRQ